jgi:hypothetical protein
MRTLTPEERVGDEAGELPSRRWRSRSRSSLAFPEFEVTEKAMLKQFPLVPRIGLWAASRWWVKLIQDKETQQAQAAVAAQAAEGNLIIFPDHLSRTDIWVDIVAAVRFLQGLTEMYIPAAAHADTGLDPEGRPSAEYRRKTVIYQWVRNTLDPTASASLRYNPLHPENIIGKDWEEKHLPQAMGMFFLSIIRGFEERVDGEAIHASHAPAMRRYFRVVSRLFESGSRGRTLFVSPWAGLAKPGRLLNQELYGFLTKESPLPYFVMGAYPDRWSYDHPLSKRHRVYLRGPFSLGGGYAATAQQIEAVMSEMRAQGGVPQDYDFARAEQK